MLGTRWTSFADEDEDGSGTLQADETAEIPDVDSKDRPDHIKLNDRYEYGRCWGEGAARCFSMGGSWIEDGKGAQLTPIKDCWVCPISTMVMEDPVATIDGCVYERSYIEQWFTQRQPITSPATGLELSHKGLMPMLVLQQAIEAFLNNRPEFRSPLNTRAQEVEQLQMQQEELAQRYRESRQTCQALEQKLLEVQEAAERQMKEAADAAQSSDEKIHSLSAQNAISEARVEELLQENAEIRRSLEELQDAVQSNATAAAWTHSPGPSDVCNVDSSPNQQTPPMWAKPCHVYGDDLVPDLQSAIMWQGTMADDVQMWQCPSKEEPPQKQSKVSTFNIEAEPFVPLAGSSTVALSMSDTAAAAIRPAPDAPLTSAADNQPVPAVRPAARPSKPSRSVKEHGGANLVPLELVPREIDAFEVQFGFQDTGSLGLHFVDSRGSQERAAPANRWVVHKVDADGLAFGRVHAGDELVAINRRLVDRLPMQEARASFSLRPLCLLLWRAPAAPKRAAGRSSAAVISPHSVCSNASPSPDSPAQPAVAQLGAAAEVCGAPEDTWTPLRTGAEEVESSSETGRKHSRPSEPSPQSALPEAILDPDPVSQEGERPAPPAAQHSETSSKVYRMPTAYKPSEFLNSSQPSEQQFNCVQPPTSHPRSPEVARGHLLVRARFTEREVGPLGLVFFPNSVRKWEVNRVKPDGLAAGCIRDGDVLSSVDGKAVLDRSPAQVIQDLKKRPITLVFQRALHE